nr:hypothetical protein CFP56_73650 [Quercus suber]
MRLSVHLKVCEASQDEKLRTQYSEYEESMRWKVRVFRILLSATQAVSAWNCILPYTHRAKMDPKVYTPSMALGDETRSRDRDLQSCCVDACAKSTVRPVKTPTLSIRLSASTQIGFVDCRYSKPTFYICTHVEVCPRQAYLTISSIAELRLHGVAQASPAGQLTAIGSLPVHHFCFILPQCCLLCRALHPSSECIPPFVSIITRLPDRNVVCLTPCLMLVWPALWHISGRAGLFSSIRSFPRTTCASSPCPSRFCFSLSRAQMRRHVTIRTALLCRTTRCATARPKPRAVAHLIASAWTMDCALARG